MTPERPRAGAADPAPPSPRHRVAARPAGKRTTRAIRRRVWTAGRLLLLAGALLATYGLFFLTAVRVTSRAREVRVPDVLGDPLPEASAAFERAGLQLRVDPVRRPDPSIPADHVASQDPEPGTVLRRNRIVRVRLSDGHRAPDVPAVVGLHERTATLTLTEARLEIKSRAEIRSPDYAPGVVIAQSPAPPARAASVALLVNREKPEPSYVMPDLIGAPAARVTDVLRSRGFRVAPGIPVTYPNLPPGIVVRQTPEPGFRLTTRETITIEVTR